MPRFSAKSLSKLDTCHPVLRRLFKSVIEETDFSVICGHRGEKEQNEAFSTGHSKLKWPKSKHNVSPSMAVDVVPYPIDWDDISRFKALADVVKKHWSDIPKAEKLGYELQWGGDWDGFKDYPHWELRSVR
jgi:peptidoglycan L-alanyl-D-glutamate endopeptidase CwlK